MEKPNFACSQKQEIKKSSQFVIDRTCVNPYSVGVFECSLSAGGAQ